VVEILRPASYEGRIFHFGVREHAMGSTLTGISLNGGLIPYGGTFMTFSDYMRPAIRLAALSEVQVIYVFTHDSMGLVKTGRRTNRSNTWQRCAPFLICS
jgi:transketolase